VISEDYKAQLVQIRKEADPKKKWGTTGARNFGTPLVGYLMHFPRIGTVLDFGAGEKTLEKYVKEHLDRPIEWTNYDPGIKGIDVPPEGKFDLIVSSDVLEHIEPEEIGNVLDWCADHARLSQYHHIACFAAGKILPDGRNVHLIVEDVDWWVDTFKRPGWDIQLYSQQMKRKRSAWQRSCQIQTDKLG